MTNYKKKYIFIDLFWKYKVIFILSILCSSMHFTKIKYFKSQILQNTGFIGDN